MRDATSETAAWAYPQVCQIISVYQGGSLDSAADEDWLRQVESKCKGALQQFQLQSKLLSKSLTPNAALLKFQGSANLTVEQVLKRWSEFLTTHGLNVISVRGEPGVVAIAIERPSRRVLHLPEVWKSWNPDHPDRSEAGGGLLCLRWIIHDEFAEWMMTEDYADAVADIVGRLGGLLSVRKGLNVCWAKGIWRHGSRGNQGSFSVRFRLWMRSFCREWLMF